MEKLSILLEATLDGDFLSGLDVETLVSGKTPPIWGCRRRDANQKDANVIGNQIVAQHLIQNIPGNGYQIKVSKNNIVINWRAG